MCVTIICTHVIPVGVLEASGKSSIRTSVTGSCNATNRIQLRDIERDRSRHGWQTSRKWSTKVEKPRKKKAQVKWRWNPSGWKKQADLNRSLRKDQGRREKSEEKEIAPRLTKWKKPIKAPGGATTSTGTPQREDKATSKKGHSYRSWFYCGGLCLMGQTLRGQIKRRIGHGVLAELLKFLIKIQHWHFKNKFPYLLLNTL